MIYYDEYIVESTKDKTGTVITSMTRGHVIKWFQNKAKRNVGYHELTTLCLYLRNQEVVEDTINKLLIGLHNIQSYVVSFSTK